MNLIKLPEKNPYIFLLFLVVMISLPLIGSSFLFIDDFDLIVNNPKLVFTFRETLAIFTKPLGQIYDASDYHGHFRYYRPALNLLYLFNKAIWGINPVGFHLTNLFLHLLTAVLVYRAGLILFSYDKTISILAAALFCVHPVHNELIGRVAMNENLLGVFIALSLYCYLLDRKYLSLIAFAGALLAKESAIMFPLVLLVYEHGKSGLKKALSSVSLFLLTSIGYLAVRASIIGNPFHMSASQDFFTSLAISFSAWADYFRLLIVPYPLNVFYPSLKFTTILDLKVIYIVLIWFLIVLIAWKIYPDKLLFRLFAASFILLIPVIINANQLLLNTDRAYIAERQLYVPTIFFSLFIAGIVQRHCKFDNLKYAVIFLYGIVILFSINLIHASLAWHNDNAVHSRFLRDYPETSISHKLKGEIFLKSGEYESALLEFRAALPTAATFRGEEQNGSLFLNPRPIILKDNLDFKEPVFNEIASYQYELTEVHFLMGEAYLAKGNKDKAIRKFKTALILQPKATEMRARLAGVYLKSGMLKEAQREFKQVTKELTIKF